MTQEISSNVNDGALRPVSSPAIPLQALLIETDTNCKRRTDYETLNIILNKNSKNNFSPKGDQKRNNMERMERAFDFEIGDVVRMKEGAALRTQVDHCEKVYEEHLTVVFYFWDGSQCCYVLNTGDDGICLICDEDSLELEEEAPMPEAVQPECAKESYFLGSVFRVNNRLVAAEGLEKAIELFRSHPSHQYETIESITLQSRDLALIQNETEE